MPQGPSFWFDTRVYLAVSAALLMIIVFYNRYFAILGVILLFVLYMYGKERYAQQQRALNVYLNSMSQTIDQATCYALQNLPVAIAIVDAEGRLHWFNSVLTDWGKGEVEQGQELTDLWPELTVTKIWGKSGHFIKSVGDRHFQVIHKMLKEDKAEQEFMILYISDISASERERAQCSMSLPVLAHIQIDNYDDVLFGLNEKQRSVILAEVNNLLVEWVTELDGFLKKYAEDMYFAVFDRQALTRAMQDKFDILDRVRAVQAGNRIPVTLSIGVAADEATVGELGQRAQSGLDLALGRGGDQVTVHIDGKVQFYGGKTKAAEKNTRVKARVVAQAIKEILGDAQRVLIMGHANEDFDSLGAAIGVARMSRYLERETHVVVSQPGVAVNKLQVLLEEYDEYQNFFITPEEAAEQGTEDTLLVVVDTHRPELTAAPALLERIERIIVIDHHRRSESFIANPFLVYLEPSASSTSELITELLMYFDNKLDLTRMEATALYAGIVVDTKNFAVQTGVRTFEAASFLRRAGADPRLVKHLFRVDFDIVKARAEIIRNIEMLPGGVVIATCPYHIKNAQMVSAQAADAMLRIEGARMSFVLFPLEDGVGISARSSDDVNVQVIMEEFGGGGHQTMAGAQLKRADIDDVKQRVIELSANYIRESDENESNPTTRS
ncbi:DHH family phosphoesterase [Propionispora vibrioides]|uniref:Cyclic-di-AMP phosphodiesterase n=1 Tax=Propionispora vibrioides TaxID=112903 RepID=A0A1H8XJY1_9FIRM|nr:DHH family phosphoesterase [Propionispora vibrioides]SEP40239.1 c-di-AMP phosphodiesterase, consists of a GGDEF-like and DHH domains [Propionispora vibrioides]